MSLHLYAGIFSQAAKIFWQLWLQASRRKGPAPRSPLLPHLGDLESDPRPTFPRYDFHHRSVVARLLLPCSLSDSSQEVPAADEAFRRQGEGSMSAKAAWAVVPDFRSVRQRGPA